MSGGTRNVAKGWLALAAIGGGALGAVGMAAVNRSTARPPTGTGAAPCPVHYDAAGQLQVDDQREADRLRRALRDCDTSPIPPRACAAAGPAVVSRTSLPAADASVIVTSSPASRP